MTEDNIRSDCAGFAGPYCNWLDNYLHADVNAHAKGFCVVEVTSTTSGKHTRVGVAYKKTPEDAGVFLNHCPWCGQDISPEFNKEAKKG